MSVAKQLTARELKAVALLAEGVSHTEISRRLGVSVRTVDRWAVKPEIKQLVLETQAQVFEKLGEEIFQKCKHSLIRGLPKAIVKVLGALDHSDVRIQVKAADSVVKWSGFYQPTTHKTIEPQLEPEESLKDYLQFLAAKNSNGHSRSEKT